MRQKVGLVIVSFTSSASAIPFVIVVFPAAKVPCIAIISPPLSIEPIFFPSSIVSSAEVVLKVNNALITLKGSIDEKANADDVYEKEDTYSANEADAKFRTEEQVEEQIDVALSNVTSLNVIVDQDNTKNYTWQIKIINGKAHFIAEEEN